MVLAVSIYNAKNISSKTDNVTAGGGAWTCSIVILQAYAKPEDMSAATAINLCKLPLSLPPASYETLTL